MIRKWIVFTFWRRIKDSYVQKQTQQNDCLHNEGQEEEVSEPRWSLQSRLMMLLVLRRSAINQGGD